MTTFVNLKHERTQEIHTVKIGWSWTLFLFSQFWAIPLFFRQLYGWAMIALVLCTLIFAYMTFAETEPDLWPTVLGLSLAMVGLSVFLGQRGNELTAKAMLRNGWVFAEPDGAVTELAKRAWSLP